MILADTSAWIEYDRASGHPTHLALAREIQTDLTAVAVTEPVLMEVLAGARTEPQASQLRHMLISFSWLPCDPLADFEGAALIYRECRRAGITPRTMTDCLIAAIAVRTEAQVLTADRDFEAFASVVPLSLAH